MNMKPKGIVNVVGTPFEGKALILGIESPGKWWLYMIDAQWSCIVSRAYITSVTTPTRRADHLQTVTTHTTHKRGTI